MAAVSRMHTLVTGMTQSGKSFYARETFLAVPDAGIFFDPKGERFSGKAVISGDRQATPDQLIGSLKSGYKIHYTPAGDLKVARKEADYICALLLAVVKSRQQLLTCVFDEAQEFAPEGRIDGGLLRLARTGLGPGIRCIFVAQRPADLSKIVTSQCDEKIFFKPSEWDEAYLSRYNFPAEEIKQKTSKKYDYVVARLGKLSGPFRKIA